MHGSIVVDPLVPQPVPTSRHIATLDLSQREREVIKRFFYNLKDGIVATHLTGDDSDVFNNLAVPLYNTFDTGDSEVSD